MIEQRAHRILVIDDDVRLSRTMATFLEMEGYDVAAVDTAEQGLAIVADEPPDLVLLDINMPGIDGVEACRRIRGSAPELPVIVVSGRDANDDLNRVTAAGASEFVAKPFALDEMRDVIRRHLAVPAAE